MKKFISALTALCLVLMVGILAVACGEDITPKDGGTALYGASLTNWWTPAETQGTHAIDASVTFNFDEIKIGDVKKITFEIFDGDTSLGTAVSEGEKLKALFNEAKIYWTKNDGEGNYQAGDDYTTITGDHRTLSCNFYEIENAEQAKYFTDIWTYSTTKVHYVDGNHGEGEKFPNKLVVKALVGKTEYSTSYQAS